MLARLAPIAILLAACSDPAELPESMQLTGVAGTAMEDGTQQCGYLVGVPPAQPFAMSIRHRSEPSVWPAGTGCTCFTDNTGLSPCSFDGDRMTCIWNELTTWSVDFDAAAMAAHVVVNGACSVDATVAELVDN